MVNPRDLTGEFNQFKINIFYKGDETREAGRKEIIEEYEEEINDLGKMLADAKQSEVWMGDTYSHREEIKATGAKWDAAAKVWMGGDTNIEIRDCYVASVWEIVLVQQANLMMGFFGTSKKLGQIHMVVRSTDAVLEIVKIITEAKMEWMAVENLVEKVLPATLPNFATEATVSAIYDILLPILGDAEVAKLKAVELSEIQFW